jgi:hypothetical protein
MRAYLGGGENRANDGFGIGVRIFWRENYPLVSSALGFGIEVLLLSRIWSKNPRKTSQAPSEREIKPRNK